MPFWTCEQCGAQFPRVVLVDGRLCDVRDRKHCLGCRPYRPLRRARKPVFRPVKLLTCQACKKEFPAKQLIDGKLRSLYRRRFCLECSAFGAHNTSRLPYGALGSEEVRLARRQRRRDSFRRSLRKRRRNRKRDLVAARGGRCVDCGYSACVEALQFHHRDPATKDFRLGAFDGTLQRLVAEAEKCDLVCANCHRRRHAQRDSTATAARIVELRRQMKLRAIAWFGGICGGCDGSYPPGAFDFHHLDPGAKEFGVSTDGTYRPWRRIVAELAKCVMLCANCHAEVHAGARQLPVIVETPAGASSAVASGAA